MIQIWAMYFAGIVSIKSHPRNEKPLDLIECAAIADKMWSMTVFRMKAGMEESKCRGS